MGAPDLIIELRRKGYSIQADGGYLDISPADNLPPELVKQLKHSKTEILTELYRERRREKVIAMLVAAPGTRYAVYVEDAAADPVICSVAIRGVATFEMEIPAHSYDGIGLLELIEAECGHGGE